MSTVKKLISIILCLALALPLAGCGGTVASGSCGESLTWTLSKGGVLSISGTGAMNDFFAGSVPWSEYRNEISSVVIENGVTSIGSFAFSACIRLVTLDIPASVTSIEYSSFIDCSAFTDISVAEDNADFSSVDGVLFNKDRTTLVCCPAGKSGGYTIPDGVKNIGASSFNDCSRLSAINIPDSLTSIGFDAFLDCSARINVSADNANYSSADGVLFDKSKTTLLHYPAGRSGSYTVPDGVVYIGDSSFYDCDSMTSVKLPESLTYIGWGAFFGCSSLAAVSIPANVSFIASGAFDWCTALTEINVAADNAKYSSADGVLFDKDKTWIILCPAGSPAAYPSPQA